MMLTPNFDARLVPDLKMCRDWAAEDKRDAYVLNILESPAARDLYEKLGEFGDDFSDYLANLAEQNFDAMCDREED